MAATVTLQQDTGTATGSPAKGTTRATVTNGNWKSADDTTTPYTSAPIARGNNSYDQFLFVKYTGSFTSISSGLWAHTNGTLGTGLTIKGLVSATYTTPSTSTNASLTTDMTSPISIGSGAAVLFGATGPEAAGKAASSTSNPTYSQYLITQLQTSGSASSGDITSCTFTFQWAEV